MKKIDSNIIINLLSNVRWCLITTLRNEMEHHPKNIKKDYTKIFFEIENSIKLPSTNIQELINIIKPICNSGIMYLIVTEHILNETPPSIKVKKK
jgi:hypothetical protein